MRFVCLLVGYGIGCINFAYIIGLLSRKIDIREHGSGNSGSTNAIRVMGWKAGAMTFLGDFLKCFLAVVVVRMLFEHEAYALYAGFGVIIGHNWPVFLKFRGGKGIASTLGLIYAADWRAGLIITLLVATIILVSRYVSLGSIVMVLLLPLVFFFTKNGNVEYVVIGIILEFIAIYRHRSNIKRLLMGNENKLQFKTNARKAEL